MQLQKTMPKALRVIPIIEVKSETITTAVIRFAISTLQTDIQAIADGSASAETVSSYTEDLLNYIAEDQNIDASKIAPNVTARPESVTIQEDTPITIDVLANDSYLPSAPITISITNGDNGSTELTESIPQKILYTPDLNYFGSDTFVYTILQGDKTSSAEVSITIESVNDLPSIGISSTVQVDENQTAVTTITIPDTDEDGDELTLTLGGTDAESFNLSSENVLTFKEAPDYETKSSYAITLSLTDGIDTELKEVEILINNLNDNSPILTVGDVSIEENIKNITTVTASDADGDPLIFSLKENVNDNSELIITPEGLLSFITAATMRQKLNM